METKKLIGGLLAGVAIGIAAGLLLAPRSGKKTLRTLAKGTKRLAKGLRGSVSDSVDSLKTHYNNGVDATTRRGKEVITNAGERIKI